MIFIKIMVKTWKSHPIFKEISLIIKKARGQGKYLFSRCKTYSFHSTYYDKKKSLIFIYCRKANAM